MAKRILGEPLLHFLLAGALLYFWSASSEPDTDVNTIDISAESLVPYIAAGGPALSVDDVPQYLDDLDEQERTALIQGFVREEVLVREAKALGLDQEDTYQRRRMISRLLYINEAFAANGTAVSEADISAWYAQHRNDYREPARVTFAHAYVAADPTGQDSSERAANILSTLNRDRIAGHRGPSYGERFLYHSNYVDSDRQEIAAHFGKAFADAVFAARPQPETWQGPWQSRYGWHAVLLTARQEAYVPPLEKLKRQIRADILAERVFRANEAFYEAALGKYRVVIDIDADHLDAG